MDKSKKKKGLVIGASVVAIGMVAATLTGMASSGGGPRGGMPDGMDEARQKTVVETQTPEIGTIAVTGSYVGTVEPGQQVTVYPKVSGEVKQVNFNVGDTVEAGDVLFQLDSSSLQYTIAQTQANLSTAQKRAELNLKIAQQDLDNYSSNVEDGLNSSLLQAESTVKSAENQLQQANNSYRQARQNYNDFIDGNYDDDYDYDTQKDTLRNAKVQAELQAESAQLQLENAKASLEAVKKQIEEQASSAENNVTSAEISADLSADQISLQKLQNDLNDYTGSSPISGVVEQRYIDPYDMASPQAAAFVISNKDMLTVSFNVTESALAAIQLEDYVTLEKDGQSCLGIISEISNMADAMTGLYTIKATVQNVPFEMRSGSSIKLYVETQKAENELVIPIDAVYYDNGTPYVYVFENNTARKVEIVTGITDTEYIQVVSGLTLLDEVIVTWSASLYDGAEVYLPGTVPEEGADEGMSEDVPDGEREDAPDNMNDISDSPEMNEPEEPASEDIENDRESGEQSVLADKAEEDAA